MACFLQQSPYCLWVLDVDTVSADRLVAGIHGGTYARSNIQPACVPCQRDQGSQLGLAQRGLRSVS